MVRQKYSLITKWYMKPTALTIPLECVSAQPWYVHTTWPKAMQRMVTQLCTSSEDKVEARKKLRQAVSASMARVLWPENCEKPTFPKKQTDCKVLWVPMPYDVRLREYLARALRTVLANRASETTETFRVQAKLTGVSADTVRWAWCNFGTRLSYRVRKTTRIVGELTEYET